MPRKSLVTAMSRTTDKAAMQEKLDNAVSFECIRRKCTGDPNTCRYSYDVAASPEIPLCGILGYECDRGQYRDELIAKRR